MELVIISLIIGVFGTIGAKIYIKNKKHPEGLFHLFFAEMWERFSFYGMRALLVLYIIKDYMKSVENNEDIAYGIYAAYGALVYATPLLGGFLADKFIGYRKAVIWGGILMALGHFFMAIPTDFFFYGALAMLIAGNGFFKPNISSLVGSLYKKNDIRRDSGFTIFYMGINLGAAVAPILCGYLGNKFGWHYGFGLAGLGMLAGIIVFWDGIQKGVFKNEGLQPKKYQKEKWGLGLIWVKIKDKWEPLINGSKVEMTIYLLSFLAAPIFALFIVLEASGSSFLGKMLLILGAVVLIYLFYLIIKMYFQNNIAASGKLASVVILASLCTVFWACFEQAGSSIVVWVDKCCNLGFFEDASQTNFINPGYIIFLAIPFSIMWSKLDYIKRNPSTALKFAMGLAFLGLGFLTFAYSINYIDGAGKIPISFLFIGWLIITTGELFLSPIGLSKITELSPKHMVGFIMGVWFLSSTFAHYIAGALAKLTTSSNEANIDNESKYTILDKLNEMIFKVDMSLPGVQEAMIYNDLFGKIGFVTIGIAIITLIISPVIKKLMHDVH
tara:strand:- start:547 stop:2214 length:1668 start_codon:yes stop_codon:yes gene_type:complete